MGDKINIRHGGGAAVIGWRRRRELILINHSVRVIDRGTGIVKAGV